MTVHELKKLSPEQLVELVNDHNGRVKLCYETVAIADEGAVRVRYHKTDILVFDYVRRQVTVNSGGWRTKTTKYRINALLPEGLTLFAERKIWKVCERLGGGAFDTYDFDDGDVFQF